MLIVLTVSFLRVVFVRCSVSVFIFFFSRDTINKSIVRMITIHRPLGYGPSTLPLPMHGPISYPSSATNVTIFLLIVTREKKMKKTENNARTHLFKHAVQTTSTNSSTPITPFYMQLRYSISPVTLKQSSADLQ